MSPFAHFTTKDPELLEVFLDLCSEGAYEWCPATGAARFSTKWLSALGLDAANVVGKVDFLLERVHDDDRSRVEAVLRGELEGRFEIEYRVRREDGHHRWTRDRGRRIGDGADGEGTHWVAVSLDIDARKRTEMALRASRAKFRSLANSMLSMVWISGNDDEPDFFNARWLEYTGKSSEDLENDGWLDLVHPDDHAICKGTCDANFEARERFSMLIRLRGRDGTYRWFHDEGTPQFDPDGKFIGFVGACVDVDEDIAKERRLEQTQFVVDNAVEAVFWVLSDATFRYVNHAAAESLGYSREEVLELTVHDIAPTAASPWIDRWNDVKRMGSTRFESTHRRKDGTDFPVEVTLRYVPDNEDGIISASARDVTARRDAEEALRASEERFALSVAGATDGLWDWDVPAGTVWYAPRFRELLGYDGDDEEGFPAHIDSFARALHPDDEKATWAAVTAHLESDVPYDVEYRLRMKDGAWRWFRARGRCIRDKSGRATRMAGSIQDVNQRVETGEELERYAKELERSNRDLDDFAYVASHDLRQPLRGIANLANWIEEDAADRLPEDSRRHLQKLQQRTLRMDRLLEDLLQYSRAGRLEGTPATIDTNELVRDVVELLGPRDDYTVEIAGKLPRLESHRAPLEQIFRNLIGNAIKHRREPGGRTLVSARDAGRFVEFSVADDGPGIAVRFQQRIFRMFQTLRPRDEVEGSGMGLAIVKKLVESRGGTIRVDSVEGEGATFRFTWPTG